MFHLNSSAWFPKRTKKKSSSSAQIEDVDDPDELLESDNEEENENQQEEDREDEERMPLDVAEDTLLGEETAEIIQEVVPSGRYLKYTVNGKSVVMLRSSII